MKNKSIDSDSPLQKTLSRTQSICILAGVSIAAVVGFGFLFMRSNQAFAPAVAREMPKGNFDIESDTPVVQETVAPAGSHEEQVKNEILSNMRETAKSRQ